MVDCSYLLLAIFGFPSTSVRLSQTILWPSSTHSLCYITCNNNNNLGVWKSFPILESPRRGIHRAAADAHRARCTPLDEIQFHFVDNKFDFSTAYRLSIIFQTQIKINKETLTCIIINGQLLLLCRIIIIFKLSFFRVGSFGSGLEGRETGSCEHFFLSFSIVRGKLRNGIMSIEAFCACFDNRQKGFASWFPE